MIAVAALAITWISVALGLQVRNPESTSNIVLSVALLPILDGVFVRPESMPSGIRWFAQYQPFTPLIDTLRGLFFQSGPPHQALIAIAWFLAIAVVGYFWELQRHRDQIAHLTAGDRLYVPADIADLLDRLRAIGVNDQTIQRERDGWILLAAAAPLHVRLSAKEKTASLDDVEFQRLYLAFDQAQEWSPDDPRLEQLADDLINYLGTAQLRELDTPPPPEIPATAIAMIASTTRPQAESHQRLLELVRERAQRRTQADAT